jgi:hypothetical protein
MTDNGMIFERLKLMPPLSHYPNRPAPFRLEQSQVVAHVRRVAQCDLLTAAKLFEKARGKKVVLFSPRTLTWSGNRDWIPLPPRRRRTQLESEKS